MSLGIKTALKTKKWDHTRTISICLPLFEPKGQWFSSTNLHQCVNKWAQQADAFFSLLKNIPIWWHCEVGGGQIPPFKFSWQRLFWSDYWPWFVSHFSQSLKQLCNSKQMSLGDLPCNYTFSPYLASNFKPSVLIPGRPDQRTLKYTLASRQVCLNQTYLYSLYIL